MMEKEPVAILSSYQNVVGYCKAPLQRGPSHVRLSATQESFSEGYLRPHAPFACLCLPVSGSTKNDSGHTEE